MNKHKYLIIVVPFAILLLLLGMMLYYTFIDPSRFWFCSPTEPRGNDEEAWKETITPVQQTEDINEDFFDNFTVGSDSDYFTIKHSSEYPPDNPFAFELHEMTPSEPLKIGGGTLKFSCIGIAYHDANQTISDDAIYRFYDPQLKSMAKTDVSKFHNPDVSKFGMYALTVSGSDFRSTPWPAVQLFFEHQRIEHLMFHAIKIFDSRTHKSLTTGYGSGGSDDFHHLNTHIPIWHCTPIDVVIDISHGPIKTFKLAPRVGEGFSEENFKCRLIGVFEGVDNRPESSSYRDNLIIHKFKKTLQDKTGLIFFFACLPAAHHMPVTFEFLDKNGNKLLTRGGSTSGYTHYIRLEQPLEKIALIRAYYRTRRRRIIVHLPYIPGLPEQNNAVKNLFDVYIPYVKLHDPGQVDQFVRGTLQLSQSRSTGPAPLSSINSAAFPMEFGAVTIREIAKLYAQGGSLSIDIENDQLKWEYPVSLWVKLRQFLQEVLP